MAKIHNPQDEKGISLINQTTFDAAVERIETNLNAEIVRSTEADDNLENEIKSFTTEKVESEIGDSRAKAIIETRSIFDSSVKQIFDATSNGKVNARGFGDIILAPGKLESVAIFCPDSNVTQQSTWLKVFERNVTGNHKFIGISDISLAHRASATLEFTFKNSNIWLEKDKEYFFVFALDSQKNSTSFSTVSDSTDSCIKIAENPSSPEVKGGLLGPAGYSVTGKKANYIIKLISKIENKFALDKLEGEISQVAFVVSDEINRATKAEQVLNDKIQENKNTISSIEEQITDLSIDLDIVNSDIEIVNSKITSIREDMQELSEGISYIAKVNDVRASKERVIAYKNTESGVVPVESIDETYKVEFELSKGKIFTYNAVTTDPIIIISDVTETPAPGIQSIHYSLNIATVPAANTTVYIILDSICGDENSGAHSQHVTHILPFEIIVTP